MCASWLRQIRILKRRLLTDRSAKTSTEIESRAWPIPKGMKAPQAAGKIHTDMERGFIRAEVYHYDDLLACGSEAKVKEKGLFRLEGKDYVIKEADIVYFRFNV
ncbi:MAG: DUF933 domain-containing protein [Nitrospira sp.]|nr:DUF933 domain-containing protein [Nitrospira sp.]